MKGFLESKSPVEQCNNYQEEYTDQNDSNSRQSEHAIKILCGMLTYNKIEKLPKNIEKYNYDTIFPGPHHTRSAIGCVQLFI
jgi:hypothetical protein